MGLVLKEINSSSSLLIAIQPIYDQFNPAKIVKVGHNSSSIIAKFMKLLVYQQF